ncbi:MAG TPA: NAD(+) synthase [Verrucomicrobiota bacterium]|jgi:NAD+ synthase (glutamine-hydrolysing)|nr:NAD(+) synthase [Verrucomicrobiota bacterium]HQL78518.1 NAD(+) synthase [Verrucomicrobiota bacterium]
MSERFDSIYSHGMIRAAVCIPSLRVADPAFNLERTLALARQASRAQVAVALFPELGLSAYSNDDLFHQDALLDASKAAVAQLVKASAALTPVLVVGAPLMFEAKLFNCAVVIYRGQVLGLVPKTYLPNYREYYEKRQFASSRDAVSREVTFLGKRVPFGNDLVFEAGNFEGFRLHAEICEDVWVPVPPSTYAALAGATVLLNLSASNITVGKAEYRRNLCAGQSGKCIAAYLYSCAGPGESTTDLAWDGHALIHENGDLLAESARFADKEQMIRADVDLERLMHDRMRLGSFSDSVADHRARLREMRRIPFTFRVPEGRVPLQRGFPRFPYVPSDARERDQRCFEAYNIQVHGLLKRLSSAGIKRIVIGISGGLDSTQALIVAARAMDRLGLPRRNILAYTMPGFATSQMTLRNAHKLMKALGVTASEIDIRPSCTQMFRDIGHPFASGKPVYDLTFENVQAGERTSHLFRLANQHNALVLGTGDLSELALGWMTYGVGDHMSHYNVNCSVSKTLIQHLIRWVVSSNQFGPATNTVLEAILATEISPELVPHAKGKSAQPAQKTADVVGPYELQDFNLYYITRHGFRPSKVAFLAWHAWGDRNRGAWPDLLPAEKRHQYDLRAIKKWLGVFLYRFFKISQFKRSAMPNGPKVGSGGALSPRGDWRAPSDSEAEVWLKELRDNVPG